MPTGSRWHRRSPTTCCRARPTSRASRIHHIETPSPHTEYGIKGVGEGGAIPPPAAIFNAVNDALRALGVELNETPLTPYKLVRALAEAEARKAAPAGT